MSAIEVGKIVSGKVSGVTNFGAFIDLDEGGTGLVHISEVACEYVKDVNDFLKMGQQIKVMVTNVDDKGKMSLSLKKVVELERKQVAARPAAIDWARPKVDNLSFEDRMAKFKQESDERMSSIKRSVEGRRGGRR